MARKRRTTKKAASKPKTAPKPEGPHPGDVPPRTGWYLDRIDSVTLAEPEEEVFRITLRDRQDNPVAAAYGNSEKVAVARATKLYAALAPKGRK